MTVTLVMGLQYGDEGKAKALDYLVSKAIRDNGNDTNSVVVVRYQGGDNAGHTVYDDDGNKSVYHALPCGVSHDTLTVISPGCVVNPRQILDELEENPHYDSVNKLIIDTKCPLVMPWHIEEDLSRYQQRIGTTARGIGPAYKDFYGRDGLTVGDLLDKDKWDAKIKGILPFKIRENSRSYDTDLLFKRYSPLIDKVYIMENTAGYLHFCKTTGCSIFLESAQGFGLDVLRNEHPFVTSSSVGVGAAIMSTGLSHKDIDNVIGVIKPYKTYVGEGSFRTEDNALECIREIANEYGATTGRPRRLGWLDLNEVADAVEFNGVDSIFLTKVDIIPEIFDGVGYIKATDDANMIEVRPHGGDVLDSIELFINHINDALTTEELSARVHYLGIGPRTGEVLDLLEE